VTKYYLCVSHFDMSSSDTNFYPQLLHGLGCDMYGLFIYFMICRCMFWGNGIGT